VIDFVGTIQLLFEMNSFDFPDNVNDNLNRAVPEQLSQALLAELRRHPACGRFELHNIPTEGYFYKYTGRCALNLKRKMFLKNAIDMIQSIEMDTNKVEYDFAVSSMLAAHDSLTTLNAATETARNAITDDVWEDLAANLKEETLTFLKQDPSVEVDLVEVADERRHARQLYLEGLAAKQAHDDLARDREAQAAAVRIYDGVRDSEGGLDGANQPSAAVSNPNLTNAPLFGTSVTHSTEPSPPLSQQNIPHAGGNVLNPLVRGFPLGLGAPTLPRDEAMFAALRAHDLSVQTERDRIMAGFTSMGPEGLAHFGPPAEAPNANPSMELEDHPSQRTTVPRSAHFAHSTAYANGGLRPTSHSAGYVDEGLRPTSHSAGYADGGLRPTSHPGAADGAGRPTPRASTSQEGGREEGVKRRYEHSSGYGTTAEGYLDADERSHIPSGSPGGFSVRRTTVAICRDRQQREAQAAQAYREESILGPKSTSRAQLATPGPKRRRLAVEREGGAEDELTSTIDRLLRTEQESAMLAARTPGATPAQRAATLERLMKVQRHGVAIRRGVEDAERRGSISARIPTKHCMSYNSKDMNEMHVFEYIGALEAACAANGWRSDKVKRVAMLANLDDEATTMLERGRSKLDPEMTYREMLEKLQMDHIQRIPDAERNLNHKFVHARKGPNEAYHVCFGRL
jgi:hypothetical protein